MDALKRSLLHGRPIASTVVADAKDDKARSFYQRYDFIPFPDHPNRLFLSTKTIEMLDLVR